MVAALFGAASAGAAHRGRPGTLDPSFGHRGKVFAAAPPTLAESEFGAAVLEPDGDLVVELQREPVYGETEVREIERRLPDGSLDPSFGKKGKTRVGAGTGLVLRGDGDLLVGASRCRGKRSSVMLLDPRGHKVPSFGTKGCSQPLSFAAIFFSVAADGRILLTGPLRRCPPCGHDAVTVSETAVARLLPDGSLDPSFGKDGLVRLGADYGVGPSKETWESLTPSGILATGDGGAVLTAGTLLLRLDAGGALAQSFGKGGVTEVEGDTTGLFSLPDGRIVVASTLREPALAESGEVVVSRFRPDGTPDPGFGDAGRQHIALPGGASAHAVAAMPGDGILVAGELSPGKGCEGLCGRAPFLTRLEPNGQLDPAYGDDGIVNLPFPSGPEPTSHGLSALVTAPDGAAVVTGNVEDAVALARSPDGTPNAGFGEGGTLIERHYLPPSIEPSGFALDSKGSFTVAAEGTAGTHEYGGFLLGFRRNGRQDPGPSGTGVVPTLARGEIQPSRGGRVVSWWGGQRSVMAVGGNGAAVRRYGKNGTVKLPRGFHALAIEAGPKGGVTVVGSVNSQQAMGVYRLDPDGRPLPGFGHHGLAEVAFGRDHALAFAAVVETSGAVVLTGWVGGQVGVARLLPNGRLDRRYGNDGRLRDSLGEDAYGTRIAPFRGGVVIAATNQKSPDSLAGIIRLDRHGHPIRGFGQRGAVRPRTDGPPLALLTGVGRIVVATDTENNPRSSGGVELRAYRADGSVDRGFGQNGLARGGVGQFKYFHPVAAVQQRDGKICVAGAAWNGEYSQVELLRFR